MKVCEEFFQQGDIEKERGQQISMYCDRSTTVIPQSQAGFLKFICMPLYEALSEFLQSEQIEKNCLQQIGKNLVKWQQQDFKSHRNKTIGHKSLKEINTTNVKNSRLKSKQSFVFQSKEQFDIDYYTSNQEKKLNKNNTSQKDKKLDILNEIIEEKMEDESTHMAMQDNSVEIGLNDKKKTQSLDKEEDIKNLLNDVKSLESDE